MGGLKYKHANSTLTLREGLTEYQNAFADDITCVLKMDKCSADFFQSHDIVHVVFGLDTSLKEEAIVDYWTLFATTLPFKQFLKALKTEEEKKLMKELGFWTMFKTFFLSISNMIKVILASLKMKKKWNWNNYKKYMDVPLNEIRNQFGIKLLQDKTYPDNGYK